jgi:integrase
MTRSALNQAVKDAIIIANPAKNVKRIKVPESKRVWLTGEELSRLATTPLDGVNGEEIRRAFLFGCYTGLRISDMKTLVWGEIAYSPMRIAKKQKKTEENVYIPVNKTAWGIINDKRIHDYREAVFPALFAARQGYHPRLVKWAKSSGAAKADRVAYGAAYVRDYAA